MALHRLTDVRAWPRVLWENPLLFALALLVGGIVSFAYSYAPLHRAKDWQLDYIEQRLEARSAQVEELEAELHSAQDSLEGTPSAGELDATRAQLSEATKLADSREREIQALGRKLESMTQSRDSWKSRHAEVLAELEAYKTKPARAPSGALEENAPPASPAPVSAEDAAGPYGDPRPSSPAASEDGEDGSR